MPAGRPPEYSEAIVEKAAYYLANYKDEGDVVPQLAGLALSLGISRDTVYAWEKDEDKKAFSYIVGDIRAAQERRLVNGGVSGEFAPKITGMMLAKHGYAEAVKADHTVNDYANLSPEERRRKLMELQQALKDADSGRA